MSRRIMLWVLVACLGWQSLAFAGLGATWAPGPERTHALLHLHDLPHHHDEAFLEHDHAGEAGVLGQSADEPPAGDHHAAGLHLDDSIESLEHLAADGGWFAPALLSQNPQPAAAMQRSRPAMHRLVPGPTPYLGSLERPPRRTA